MQLERGVRICERNNSAENKVSEEGGGRRCLRCQSREYSLAERDEEHGDVGSPPAALGGPQWSRYPPAASEGSHPRASECLKEAVTPWRAHAEASSWQDLWTCGKRPRHSGAGLLTGLVTLWGTHAEAACS